MSDERDGIPDPGAPATDEEVAASQKLRDALDEDPVASALKAAWAPEPISAEAHQRIVDDVPTAGELEIAARAEEDPIVLALKAAWAPSEISAEAHQRILDDVPTKEELELASVVDQDDMVAALQAAWNPRPIDDREHQRILDRALVTVRPMRSRLRVAVVTTTTVFALAAGVVLFLQTEPSRAPKTEALAKARSTQSLFERWRATCAKAS